MTLFAGALPGLRDLRAPATAGYLWLAVAWLFVQPNLDETPDSAIGRSLFELGDTVGTIGVAAAVSVVAYLVGVVSQEASDQILKRVVRKASSADSKILERVRAIYDRGWDRIESLGAPKKEKDRLFDELGSLRDLTTRQVREQLRLPATLLVGEHEQLFSAIDRLRAEGDFRAAVTLPLLALAAVLALDEHFASAIALAPMALAIGWQGIRRGIDSQTLIANTLLLDRVALPVLASYEEWADSVAVSDGQMSLQNPAGNGSGPAAGRSMT